MKYNKCNKKYKKKKEKITTEQKKVEQKEEYRKLKEKDGCRVRDESKDEGRIQWVKEVSVDVKTE